jgi:hypothetical protein
MINITLNKKTYKIPKVSELSFKDFSKIMIDKEVSELSEYLSLFTDMSIDTLMNSEFRGNSVASIYLSIFDIDIKSYLETKFNTINYNGEILPVENFKIDLFGKHYLFGLYYERFKAKKINIYELSIYCLAIALEDKNNSEEVEKIYLELTSYKWNTILSQSFFLLRKFLKKKKGSWIVLMICMLRLRATRYRVKSQTKKLIHTEKKLLLSY